MSQQFIQAASGSTQQEIRYSSTQFWKAGWTSRQLAAEQDRTVLLNARSRNSERLLLQSQQVALQRQPLAREGVGERLLETIDRIGADAIRRGVALDDDWLDRDDE